MKVLDLFCGAGGASMGYHRAGFDVIGVDIKKQPHYLFQFKCADALTYPLDGYDLIHASPPCQRYNALAKRHGTSENHPDLIDPIREKLIQSGIPYVIENIPGAKARLQSPIRLCGTMFGLGVFRHRYFETSWLLTAPIHNVHMGWIGDGTYVTVTGKSGGSSTRDQIQMATVDDWCIAMDIWWMTGAELSQAIPPAYTRWIGQQWIDEFGKNNS